MSLAAYLNPGLLVLYGIGTAAGATGIIPPSEEFKFGIVDNVGTNPSGAVSAGQSVMFRDKDIVAILSFNNWQYTLLPEDKIILTENISVL